VAPYTIIRTTAVFAPSAATNATFTIFGPNVNTNQDAGQWTNSYAVSTNVPMSDLMNSANGVVRHAFGSMTGDGWGHSTSATPAAFSIQIMNPEALQTTSGMLYIGRAKQRLNLNEMDLSNSFQDLADSLVSYSNPRLCSAGKLALRGVQVDAIPNNMSKLADFSTLQYDPTATVTTLTTGSSLHSDGFNPIFVYNPTGVRIQVLVTCEWRVRFDPTNPAYASVVHHPPSSDATWAKTMETALMLGNGVCDIAERVAEIGSAARRAVPLAAAITM
jgi:hypothetical protein